jgi:hypothetical protein
MMRSIAIAAAIVGALCCTHGLARAETANKCKECRDYLQACVKAHSQALCKGDYEVCMKHCRGK